MAANSKFITRCAWAHGRVKRLSPSICVWVCVCVCGSAKTRLFAFLLLENRHEIALYRSASQFIFFERCLQSRTSLLSSAMAMVSRHEIALYRSASQFIFFERCLQSRTSLLSSAMAMVSNSCTAPRVYRTLR